MEKKISTKKPGLVVWAFLAAHPSATIDKFCLLGVSRSWPWWCHQNFPMPWISSSYQHSELTEAQLCTTAGESPAKHIFPRVSCFCVSNRHFQFFRELTKLDMWSLKSMKCWQNFGSKKNPLCFYMSVSSSAYQ